MQRSAKQREAASHMNIRLRQHCHLRLTVHITAFCAEGLSSAQGRLTIRTPPSMHQGLTICTSATGEEARGRLPPLLVSGSSLLRGSNTIALGVMGWGGWRWCMRQVFFNAHACSLAHKYVRGKAKAEGGNDLEWNSIQATLEMGTSVSPSTT